MSGARCDFEEPCGAPHNEANAPEMQTGHAGRGAVTVTGSVVINGKTTRFTFSFSYPSKSG
jgi:hypothetical protein